MSDKKVNLKIMNDINDQEINTLMEGLKKIKGFDLSIDSYVKLSTRP
jgi:molybdenum cofactor biosynthesis enzyme MoaA